MSTTVEIYALLVGAIIFGIGYCAGHLHTRARMRAAALRGDFNIALDRVEVWCRYLAAELKDADARQDRRNDFMLKRAVGLMDTVQIPTLRAAGTKDDAASVSLPAQARRARRDAAAGTNTRYPLLEAASTAEFPPLPDDPDEPD